MNRRIRIHAVWAVRNETLEECVRRLDEILHRLAGLASEWSKWFRGFKSVADRKRGPVYLEHPDLIRDELAKGQHRHEGRIVRELGYFFTALAGPPVWRETEGSMLSLRCCCQTPNAGRNTLAITLPEVKSAPNLYDAELLARGVTALADVWDPDWVVVWDFGTKLTRPPWDGEGPVLGWINYLPIRTGVVETPLPEGWHWFAERGDKQIFIHEGGLPDEANPQHIAAFREMFRRIRWGAPL